MADPLLLQVQHAYYDDAQQDIMQLLRALPQVALPAA